MEKVVIDSKHDSDVPFLTINMIRKCPPSFFSGEEGVPETDEDAVKRFEFSGHESLQDPDTGNVYYFDYFNGDIRNSDELVHIVASHKDAKAFFTARIVEVPDEIVEKGWRIDEDESSEFVVEEHEVVFPNKETSVILDAGVRAKEYDTFLNADIHKELFLNEDIRKEFYTDSFDHRMNDSENYVDLNDSYVFDIETGYIRSKDSNRVWIFKMGSADRTAPELVQAVRRYPKCRATIVMIDFDNYRITSQSPFEKIVECHEVVMPPFK